MAACEVRRETWRRCRPQTCWDMLQASIPSCRMQEVGLRLPALPLPCAAPLPDPGPCTLDPDSEAAEPASTRMPGAAPLQHDMASRVQGQTPALMHVTGLPAALAGSRTARSPRQRADTCTGRAQACGQRRARFHAVLSDMCHSTIGNAAADGARSLALAWHAARLALTDARPEMTHDLGEPGLRCRVPCASRLRPSCACVLLCMKHWCH